MPRNPAPKAKKPKLTKEPVVKQDGIPSDLVMREPAEPDPIEEEPRTQEDPGEFDPTKVKTGNIKNKAKIAAKIEAARLAHDAKANWSGDDANPIEDVKAATEKINRDTGLNPEPQSIEEAKSIEKEPPAPPVQVIERRIEMVTVEIPLGEPPRQFRELHIETLLRGDHAHTFARLRQALRDQDARTDNGQEVKSGPDVLRWIMEQFAK